MLVSPIPHTDLYELKSIESIFVNKIKYTMEPGFISDGASIPRLFWTVTTTPFHPKIIRGAFWHDWFYRTHYILKKKADLVLKRLAKADGLDPDTVETIYQTVKVAGFSAWKAGPTKPLVGAGLKKDLL